MSIKRLLQALLIGLIIFSVSGCTTPVEPAEFTEPAEFEVSSLTVTPSEVVAGESVTVMVDIENVGGLEGTYTATLTVDKKVVDTKDITLDAGATEQVSFTSSLESAGTHTIELGGLTATATALKPAEFEVSSPVVTPTLVLPGQEATVQANITNVGEAKGSLTTTLRVNGVEMDTRSVTLVGGATDKASFTVIRDLTGTYDISVDGRRTTLTVAEVETYKNEQYHYSISYPTDWTLDEETPESVWMGKVGIAGIVVSVDILTAAASLDDFYAISIEDYESGWSDFQLVSRQDVMENEEVVAIEVTAEATLGGTP